MKCLRNQLVKAQYERTPRRHYACILIRMGNLHADKFFAAKRYTRRTAHAIQASVTRFIKVRLHVAQVSVYRCRGRVDRIASKSRL